MHDSATPPTCDDPAAMLLALHVACLRAGAVYLPMNSAYTDRELGDLLDDAEPALVVREGATVHGRAQVTLAELVAESTALPTTFTDGYTKLSLRRSTVAVTPRWLSASAIVRRTTITGVSPADERVTSATTSQITARAPAAAAA